MHYQIFVPHNLGRKSRGELLGYKIHNTYVVIQEVESRTDGILQFSDPEVQYIGQINGNGNADAEGYINLQYDESHRKLVASLSSDRDNDSYTIVSYSPPNLRNLEYFTVRPILLQSTGQTQAEATLINKIAHFRAVALDSKLVFVSEDIVLDKINKCRKIRAELSDKRKHDLKEESLLSKTTCKAKSLIQGTFFFLFHRFVFWLLALTVPVIRLLNHTFYDTTPVKISAWCKQLDLRLRQISYFPIQFLCYYDTSILSSNFLQELELPDTNLRHNINNSNYINLYNSLWLIVNDILIGTTSYRLYARSGEQALTFLNGKVLGNLAFGYLRQLISWVGSDHPGGFKLNNELGQFLENMFVWTLEAWNIVLQDLIKVSESDLWLASIIKYWLIISCWCGVSFIIAALIDCINFATLHIYFFNIVTTKIFHQQMEMLKSLTQLFRGKKYNILRNRIDNLEDDQFHIDQLLMGTFIFMILIYLLPTTFAFYLLFFCSRVSILILLKIGEKVIIILNLYPLFVILLKLKNSRRLQGGIYFEAQGSFKKCNWLTMENKALTFDEILRNFVTVFRKEGKFRRFAMNFVEGREIAVEDTRPMKLHYLMLPGNYDKLIHVWQNTNVLNCH